MRHRGLVLLLAVTAGDYALWNWSVAGSHDVLALASGLTLPPLGAVSLGLVVLGVLRALARSMRGSSRKTSTTHSSREPTAAETPAASTASTSDSSAGRLAA